MDVTRDEIPWVIGHRGACGHAPENTLASLRKAAELGVRWVEFDVKLTRDGRLIVFHDDTLKRTTNGKGRVAEMDMADFRELDAGGWFGPDFEGEGVPALDETIAELARLGLGAMVESKPTPGRERETGAAIAQALASIWPDTLPPPVIVGFSDDSLAAARESEPGIEAVLNIRRFTGNWRGRLERLGCRAVHCRHQYLTRAKAADVIGAGYQLRCFTVNTARRARTMANWGVHGIFTNFPNRIPYLIDGTKS